MTMLIAFGLKLLGFFGGANVGTLITGVTDVLKNKTNADVTNGQTGADLGMKYLTSVNELNRIKEEHKTERQIIAGLLLFAVPTGIVWWAALMDGIPWNFTWLGLGQHVIGSWKIAVPPEFIPDFHTIVQSFFVAAPTLAGVAMLARVFKK
jgi:hypothetical protein